MKSFHVLVTPGLVATLSNCRKVLQEKKKVIGTAQAPKRSGLFFCFSFSSFNKRKEKRKRGHRGETHGYGKNPMNRDNRQPSPKVSLSLFFFLISLFPSDKEKPEKEKKKREEAMDAVHRLNGSGWKKKNERRKNYWGK